MAEYILKDGESHEEVAQRLLAEVEDPQGVTWSPRPDVYGGGVYVVNDEAAVAKVATDMARVRDEEAQRIAEAQRLADERDAKASETGMTPTELGIPANRGTDPGAPGTEGTASNPDEDDSDKGDDSDDPSTPEDESTMTPAQRRKAARERKAAEATAAEQSNDGASEEAK
jgi:hypothetical protein